jgi:hypothetical protein
MWADRLRSQAGPGAEVLRIEGVPRSPPLHSPGPVASKFPSTMASSSSPPPGQELWLGLGGSAERMALSTTVWKARWLRGSPLSSRHHTTRSFYGQDAALGSSGGASENCKVPKQSLYRVIRGVTAGTGSTKNFVTALDEQTVLSGGQTPSHSQFTHSPWVTQLRPPRDKTFFFFFCSTGI